VRRQTVTPAVLISAALALLLITYVFTGHSSRDSASAPHCTSREALDQVKAEIFRRAGELRGTQDPAFANVARHSVIRVPTRVVRRLGDTDNVRCTGTIALDLPPGVAAVGGQRSVAAPVAYDLQDGPPSGTPRLAMLSKADGIVMPLATLFQTAPQATQMVAEPAGPSPASSAAPSRIEPQLRQPLPPPAKKQPPPSVPRELPKAPPRTPPAARQIAPATSPPAPRSILAPIASPVRAPATASPSFNCRYARTGAEVAVCNDPSLARLDREMAGQFFNALSVARPGQRAMLQRTRRQFLRVRDSCGSEACIADSYRARMREISAIMAGGW
jgi:uncharacterized protein YecT (DUF1311 family)